MTIVVRVSMLLLTALLAWFHPGTLLAQDQVEVANPDVNCLRCHTRNLKKKLEDGETMSLQIDADMFSTSVHTVIGCTGCHRDVPKGRHPSREPVESRRAYSLKHNQTCGQCHAANFEEYEGSIHAHLVAKGDENAPLCSDCHSSHAIQPRAVYRPANGEPCSKCHEAVYEAYATSVHGEAYESGNQIRADYIQSPMCFDCHRPHNVLASLSVTELVTRCTNCHEVSRLAHEQWLPNADMHLDTVSCPVCHSPGARPRIDLRLLDEQTRTPIVTSMDEDAVQAVLADVDPKGDGLDPFELWKLLRLANDTYQAGKVALGPRMEVQSQVEAHRLAPRGEAVRDCENCHEVNSAAFSDVTVSVHMEDGRRLSTAADPLVLRSAISVDSLGGFYAPGGTRIRAIDWLLLLAVFGGLAIPVGHITLGRILRKIDTSGQDTDRRNGE